MKNGRMQCKDVPEMPILLALSTFDGWATHWTWPEDKPKPEPANCMPSVAEAMPPETPEQVRLAKMSNLLRRGLVDGCDCGCRGDWVITEKGREALQRWLAPDGPTWNWFGGQP